jgi:hypothetical protein
VRTPEQAVQHQLDAYNAHDLQTYLQVYDPAVKVYRPPAPEPAFADRQALGDFYRDQRFNLPGLRADLLHRSVVGNKVVDHERVHGVGDQPFEVVVAYEVVDGLIRTVWFFS